MIRLALLVLLACSSGPEVVGTSADPEALAREVQPLREDSRGTVVVAGTVGEVCTQGCWFYLLDTSSMVFVQLDLASGLVIPRDSGGREVIVRGRIVGEGAERVLEADTVVLK